MGHSQRTQAANESQLMKTSPDPRRMLLFAAIIGLAAASARAAATRTVVFFGDSLTAGYGLEDP